jgi:hypothetical protein
MGRSKLIDITRIRGGDSEFVVAIGTLLDTLPEEIANNVIEGCHFTLLDGPGSYLSNKKIGDRCIIIFGREWLDLPFDKKELYEEEFYHEVAHYYLKHERPDGGRLHRR